MKMIMGVLLVILGIAALVYPQISVAFQEHIVISSGQTTTSQVVRTIVISPIIGAAAITGGLYSFSLVPAQLFDIKSRHSTQECSKLCSAPSQPYS